MLASLLGITMALVLQQGDVNRQHLHAEMTCVYVNESIWSNTGDYITPVISWVNQGQYHA